tara:strand:- start:44 stop:163 length:120 start_codon:yes stop_codon:yes gene_type:complete
MKLILLVYYEVGLKKLPRRYDDDRYNNSSDGEEWYGEDD